MPPHARASGAAMTLACAHYHNNNSLSPEVVWAAQSRDIRQSWRLSWDRAGAAGVQGESTAKASGKSAYPERFK